MRLIAAASLLSTATAFAPSYNQISSSSRLYSAVEIDAPTRVAPGAGYIPEWEDRVGLSPEEFMKSDMTKPDLSGMWECPLTRWDSDG
jgi:hypothetical protein